MFINATGFYVPEERVDNQHFLELNGLTSEWIEQRTGIRSRSKAKAEENINTMSMESSFRRLSQMREPLPAHCSHVPFPGYKSEHLYFP